MPEVIQSRYKLLKKRGSGGTGDVFQAYDLRLKRMVALKKARDGTPEERHRRSRRLIHEAEHLARIRHPNVVTLHDMVEEGGLVAIVMELVDGIPYRKLFKRGPIPEHEFLRYFRQLVAALEAVHAASIIHRDVNPRNVLLLPDETVKLGDFGLSCVAGEESRPGGTIGYMAPEALRKDQRMDYGVDVYGLGFLAYQSLLGGPMFLRLYGTIKAIEWARWVLSREKFRTLTALGAPVTPGLSAIVERMVEKDPRERYTRMADVRKDLERLLGRPIDR
jgi:serine/threonine protein kinase